MAAKRRLRMRCLPANALVLILLLGACSTPAQRTDRLAKQGGLSGELVQGTGFRHQIWSRIDPGSDVLRVFIEGDGLPWIAHGSLVSEDPSPRRPLALELAVRTPASVLYLGRPCYFSARADPACTEDVWTSGRYSAQVVDSLAAVIRSFMHVHHLGQVVLIGYSGGGALAVLVAPQIPETIAVVTIAANLDIEAWSAWHGYLPLSGSLNPATQPPLAPTITQLHLIGGQDTNVTELLDARYLDQLRQPQLWRYAGFDHTCCWVEHWPELLGRIAATLKVPPLASPQGKPTTDPG